MRRKKQALKLGFSLIELIVTLSIFSLVIIGVLVAVSRIYELMILSRSEIIAINYAKSGMEGVMNIRDTNWKKYSSARDENWLRSNPFDSSSALLQSWLYVLLEQDAGTDVVQNYFLLSRTGASASLNTPEYWERMYTHFRDQSEEDRDFFEITGSSISLAGTKFYRIVRVFGVFDKRNASTNQECPMIMQSYSCPALELRYCVKVLWDNRTPGETELCGILTNFKE